MSAGVEFEAVDRDIEKLFGCEDERDVEKLFGCEDERQLFGCEDERQLFGCVQQKIHLFGCEDERVIEKQPRSPVLSLNGSNLSYRKACQILCQAAMKDKWSLAEPILKEKPSFVREEISKQRDTMLHLATAARSTRVLRELIKLMDVGDLELKNNDESTAFFVAAVTGTVEIAKAMRERNNNLPNIRGEDGILPIEVAALFGYKDMVSYLFKVTDLDVLSQEERLRLLQATTQSEMYEVSLDIFRKDRQLASKILQGNVDVLHILAHKSLAISNQVVAYSPWRKFITNTISMATRQFIPWILPKSCVLKQQAGLLLEELWAECERSSEDELLEVVKKEYLLHSAAKAGNVEFLAVIIRSYPELIWQGDNQNWTIFHVAVLYRQEKVFSLIRQLGAIKNIPIQMFDDDGNSILHLAGKLGKPHHKQKAGPCMSKTHDNVILQQLFEGTRYITETESLETEEKIMLPSFLKVSGAALQMQRERLWFKEVEKLVPSSLHKLRNNDGKTPSELFTEEHKVLLKEGEIWMKDTANSCMIAATLIATMVFAAGFTLPGGNNSDNGIPVLLKLNGFTIFVISDTVALFSSIASIIMFLSILTSRYAEDDFLVSLPFKLLFGLTTLFVSIISMLLAFAATFFLVYTDHTDWEPNLIAAFVGVPVALFGSLQYKLWFDVVKSTCSSRFLFRPGNQSLF